MTINGTQDSGVAVDATGEIAEADPVGKAAITTVVDAGASADFALEVKLNNGQWTTYKTWSTVSSIAETVEIACREARLSVTTAATAGTTAEVYFAAGD